MDAPETVRGDEGRQGCASNWARALRLPYATTMETPSSPLSVRRSQRRAIRRAVYVECQVVREHDFKLIARHAVDLSPDGMLVLADVPVLTGEDVIVTFRAPISKLWFDTVGTVARIVHGRRPGDPGRCIGIQFDVAEQFSQALLAVSLRKVPPPLPRRAPRLDYAAMVSQTSH